MSSLNAGFAAVRNILTEQKLKGGAPLTLLVPQWGYELARKAPESKKRCELLCDGNFSLLLF